jgi:hypothetical protein
MRRLANKSRGTVYTRSQAAGAEDFRWDAFSPDTKALFAR